MFLLSLWSWACIRCPPSHQSPQTAAWSPSSCLCHVCLRLSFFSCIIQWKINCLNDSKTMTQWMNECTQVNNMLFWSDSLCSPLLQHLRFGSLTPVSHFSSIQFADQRQHLSGGLISAGAVDQRSVSLQHQVGVLWRKHKHSRPVQRLCFKSQWTAYLDDICKHHKPDRALCAYVLLKDYLIQKYIKHLLQICCPKMLSS